MKLHWPTILLGIVGGVLISLLGLAAIIAVVIAFSAADSIAAVQALPRYGFAVSLMAALAAAWGAFLAVRRRPAHPSGHGVFIGLGIGIIYWLAIPTTLIGHLLMVMLALPAGIFGGRLAYLNPPKSKRS